jgi:glycosyltransferase involved in cell wall biosynthesis
MAPYVAAFTDTYLPTINGATYTIETWRERWAARRGRMDVVYPDGDHTPDDGEHPVRSLPFPFYQGFRLGAPRVPDPVRGADIVHAHSPFTLGLAGYRLARSAGLPFVVSYHTPIEEYAEYVVPDPLTGPVRWTSRRWERAFLDRADAVLAPSETAREDLRETVGVTAPIEVVPNGVDIDRFRPVDGTAFRERHGLPDGPLVGYTGRHGYEKRLRDLIEAAAGLDVPVVLGGDGPARDDLADLAADLDADVRFLGFLDRADLPAFYSTLSVFAFPSPVETQGLGALEAIACGTPVVGADAGALVDTVDDGVTGYRFPAGDPAAFAASIERALANRKELRRGCLAAREEISVEHAIDRLATVYDGV